MVRSDNERGQVAMDERGTEYRRSLNVSARQCWSLSDADL